MPGKFVLKKSGKGFHWNLQSNNGKVIATSEHYESRRAAVAGIEAVRKKARGAKLVDVDAKPAKTTSAKKSGKKVTTKRASKKVTAKRAGKNTATRKTAKKTAAKRTAKKATSRRTAKKS
jgi:uncharacterized protein YegP (UPF0339 family)